LYYQFEIGTEPLLTPAYSSFVATRPTLLLVQLRLALNLSKMQSHITMTVATANFYFK
jgi:hypothetical protein